MVFYAQTITKEHSTNNTKSKPQRNCRYIIEAEIIIVSIVVVFIYNVCYNIVAEINFYINRYSYQMFAAKNWFSSDWVNAY